MKPKPPSGVRLPCMELTVPVVAAVLILALILTLAPTAMGFTNETS